MRAERSASLCHQIIKQSFVCKTHFRIDLSVCSNIQTAAHESFKKKTRMFILLHNLSPVRCDVGEGGLSVRRGRSVGGGLRSPRSSRYGPHHRRLHGGVCSQEPDVLVEEERRLGKRNFLFFINPISYLC